MESLAFSLDQLNTLRLHDTAKVWTNYAGQPTPPSIVVDMLVHFFEIVDAFPDFGSIKFQLRTLYFSHLLTFDLSSPTHAYLYKLGLTCLYYILDANQNIQALDILQNLVQAGEFDGFFMTTEHAEILMQLSMNAGSTQDLTTPYDYINVVISQDFRKVVKEVIDLSLIFLEVCNMSAEEVFLACCIFVCEHKLEQGVSMWMEIYFNQAILGALQLKQVIQVGFDELMGSDN